MASAWEISWRGDLSIAIYETSGNIFNYFHCHDSYSFVPKGGNFYLEVAGFRDENWQVTIHPIERQDLEPTAGPPPSAGVTAAKTAPSAVSPSAPGPPNITESNVSAGATARGQEDRAAKEALVDLDDCLAKAVAKQPPGRPLERLVEDLRYTCQIEISVASTRLMKAYDMSEEDALRSTYYQHVGPAAARRALEETGVVETRVLRQSLPPSVLR
jgi:hypothetical protein